MTALVGFINSGLSSLPCGFLFVCTAMTYLQVKKLWRQLALLIAASISINSNIFIGDPWGILAAAVVLFPSMMLLCGGGKLARFSISLVLFSVVVSLSAIFTSVRPPWNQYGLIFSFFLWLCTYLVVRRVIEPEVVQRIRSGLWLILDVLSLLPFAMVVVITAGTELTRTFVTEDEFTDTLLIGNERVLLILLALAALYAVGLLLFVAFLAKQEELQRQQVLWTIRQQHYAALEQNQLQIRRLRHDLANHLGVMAGLDNHAMRDYLFQLTKTPAMTGGRRFCENEVVNAVISGKLPLMEQESIHAEIAVTIPENAAISDIDLCAVFSNCLDNAIEACRKCKKDERHITLVSTAQKGILAIKLNNSMTGMIVTNNGELVSSKQEKDKHGLGMAEIRDIVRQHNGTLQYRQTGDTFLLQISMMIT